MADPIQRWSPFREMEHFRRDFDDLFDRFLGRRKRGEKETAAIEPVGGSRVSRRLGDYHARGAGAALQAAYPSAGASGARFVDRHRGGII